MNNQQLDIFDFMLPDLEEALSNGVTKQCTHTVNNHGALPWEQEEHKEEC